MNSISKKDFDNALKVVALSDATQKYIRISGDGQKLVITACAASEQARTHVSYKGDAFPEIAVNNRILGMCLSSFAEDEVGFYADSVFHLEDAKGMKFQLPLIEDKEVGSTFVEPDNTSLLGEFVVTEKMEEKVKILPSVIEKDATRPFCMGVNLVAKGGKMTAFAAKPSACIKQVLGPVSGNWEACVPAPFVGKMTEGTKISIFKNVVKAASKDGEFYARLFAAADAATKLAGVFAKEPPVKVLIKRADVLSAFKAVSLLTNIGEGGHMTACEISGVDTSTLILSANSDVAGHVEVPLKLMKPANIVGYHEGVDATFPLFLKARNSVLLSFGLGTISGGSPFSVSEETKGEEDDFQFVFMPMRVKK